MEAPIALLEAPIALRGQAAEALRGILPAAPAAEALPAVPAAQAALRISRRMRRKQGLLLTPKVKL